MRVPILLAPFALAACASGPVIEEKFIEVKVPVSVPCVLGERPTEVVPLKEQLTREEWDAMSTDQREKLLLANGLVRKTYGNKLYVATAGCP